MIIFISFFILFIRKFLDILLQLFKLNMILKVGLLLFFFFLFCYIFIYTKLKRIKLSNLRKIKRKFPYQYALKNIKEHIINIFILSMYPIIFIIGILYLRISTMYKNIDLIFYYKSIKNYISYTSNLDLFLTIILLIQIFILYQIIIRNIIKIIRFHIIKRHLFLSYDSSKNKYTNLILYLKLFTPVNVFKWMLFMKRLIIFSNIPLNGDSIGLCLGRFWSKIRYYFHYILFIILLFYDILINDFILKKIFIILPFVFLYDIWVKLCKFIDGLQNFYDMYIHYILYDKVTILDHKYVQVGPFLLEHDTIRKIYMYYILTDLVHNREGELNEDLSPEEILKNKKITWFDLYLIYYKKFKIKLKEVFIDPLV